MKNGNNVGLLTLYGAQTNSEQSKQVAIGELLDAVLDDAGSMRQLLDVLAGSPVLRATGFDIRERPPAVEKFAERNAEIRRKYNHGRGLSLGQLANIYGISRTRIHAIIRRGKKC